MSLTVCLLANTIGYQKGGGHLWEYLNWALGCLVMRWHYTPPPVFLQVQS